MALQRLPKELLRSLKEYIGDYGYYQLYFVNKSMYKMNITEVRSFSLSTEFTKQFLTEAYYRRRITSQIKSPYHQINLNLPLEYFWLNNREDEEEVLSILQKGVNSLTIQGADLWGDNQIEKFFTLPIGNLIINTVSFTLNNNDLFHKFHDQIIHLTLKDILELDQISSVNTNKMMKRKGEYTSKLQSLTLYDCYDLKSIDITSFPCLHTILMNGCSQIKDIHNFSHLSKLTIISCLSISDISVLGDIHDLVLINCPNITDISSLNNNYKIYIENCYNIRDYSNSFQNTSILTLKLPINKKKDNNGIIHINYYHWKNMKELTFYYYFPYYSRIPSSEISLLFQSLRSLTLYKCNEIRDVESFIYIPILSLQYLNNLTSLLPIRVSSYIRSISIVSCPHIQDYSPLRHIERVSITGDHNLVNLEEVNHVKDLTFTATNQMFNHCLLNYNHNTIQRLTVYDSPWDSFNEFSDINELFIINPRHIHYHQSHHSHQVKLDKLINCQKIYIKVKKGYNVRECLFHHNNTHFINNNKRLLEYYHCYIEESETVMILLQKNHHHSHSNNNNNDSITNNNNCRDSPKPHHNHHNNYKME